jgi:AcrR family transcriptional regulator
MARIAQPAARAAEGYAGGRPARAARAYKSSEVRRLEVAEAARLLIILRGSEHLTVRNIARQIGLTEAAIYRHFRSKREILLFLSDLLADQLVEDLRKAAAGEVDLRTVDRVLRAHLSRIEQKRGVSFLVFAEILSFGDQKLNRRTARNLNRYIRQLGELLERGTKGCPGTGIQPQAAAQVLFGMIQGLVSLWALSSYEFDLLRRYAGEWKVFRRALLGGGRPVLAAEVVQGSDQHDDD